MLTTLRLLTIMSLTVYSLMSCGGSGSSKDGANPPSDNISLPKSVAGVWDGSLTSAHMAETGSWCVEFDQNNNLLSGTIYLKNPTSTPAITGTLRMPGGGRLPLAGAAVYIAGGTSKPVLGEPLTGSISENSLQFLTTNGSGYQFSGSLIEATQASGTYLNQIFQDNGDWTAIKQAGTGNSCVPCKQPDEPHLDFTCTDANGYFRMNIPSGFGGTVTIKAQSGSCSAEVTVPTGSSDINLGDVVCDLPGNIAVVTGAFDRMEDLLAKLGLGAVDSSGRLILGTETFDLFDGVNSDQLNNSLGVGYPNFSELLIDRDNDGKADIYDYKIVFINCGNTYEELGFLSDSGKRQIILDYVHSGGKLYVTDLSYDFVEQVFPEYIDFYGSDSTPAAIAEAHNAAQQGTGNISINATIADFQLAQWLGVITCKNGPCLNPDGTVHIDGFLPNWVIINGIHPSKISEVKIWISDGSKPLTLSFEYGAGKILFSSYHTEETSGGDISVQERILQYLVFML